MEERVQEETYKLQEGRHGSRVVDVIKSHKVEMSKESEVILTCSSL
jgi:hypothetical protein